ncbi:MAG: helix-turn-helix domain-containing protein [Coriobacteriia bacterium]
MYSDLGDTLRTLRLSRGETLTDVADATGVSVAMLSRLERGQRSPSPETLCVLAGHFGLPAEEMLGEAIAERMCDRYGVEPASWAAVALASHGPGGRTTVALETQATYAARPVTDATTRTATIAVRSAVRELARSLAWGTRAQAIRACQALGGLAEIPRQALREVAERHPDPAVRDVAADLLSGTRRD